MVVSQVNDFGRRWHLLFRDDDDDQGTHVEFDINSLVVLKRILEASPCLTLMVSFAAFYTIKSMKNEAADYLGK